MLKRFAALFFMFVLAFSTVGSALAAGDGPLGVVPVTGGPGQAPSYGGGGGPLTYHSGPVMHTNKTYAIYWIPAGFGVAAGYQVHINQFFKDVAAASGLTTNVYYTDTQYYSTGPSYISNTSTFGGSYNDPHAFPASGCALYTGVTKCLTDAQLRTEIKRVIVLKGWAVNGTSEFFLFTPKGVGSCYDPSHCAFTYYCAYHWNIANRIIYANQPYTETLPGGAGCGLQGFTPSTPNGFPADSTISVVSHEHNESITDPLGNGWWDPDPLNYQAEDGDLCAWNFGTHPVGYNQTINGHHYFLQQEWSNVTTRCRLSGH